MLCRELLLVGINYNEKTKNMNAGLKSMKNKGIFQFQFTEIKEYG